MQNRFCFTLKSIPICYCYLDRFSCEVIHQIPCFFFFQPASPDSLIINESLDASEEDDFLDDESCNDHLKLKMIRRGNKIFRVRTVLLCAK